MNSECIVKIKKISCDDVDKIEKCLLKDDANKIKRQLRNPLLVAYDSHKTTVLYEEKYESYKEKQDILNWKQSLLDLKKEAFEESKIPSSIKYFLKK